MTHTPTKHRRGLFNRLEEDLPPLSLTSRDLSILKLVSSYRFLNTYQIQALVGGSAHNVSQRLSRLFCHGYLDRPAHQRELRTEGYRVLIHALGIKGARLLAKRSADPSFLVAHLSEKNRTARRFHLAHTLMVAQFHICLSLACQNHPGLTLSSWQLPEKALIRIQLAHRRVPVIPDAYFVLSQNSGKEAHFYLEADRGTMTQTRFLSKLKAYWRIHSTATGSLFPRSFRVLTVAHSKKRTQNLAINAKDADSKGTGSRMFYFTCEDSYSLDHPEALLNPIWRTPADNKLHSLVE